jgi:hypothetical protein
VRIAYLHPRPGERLGSARKYFDFMRQHFGGEVVKGLGNHDLAVVRGDRYTDWTMPVDKGIPYLLIEHDSASMRQGSVFPGEYERMMWAKAVIFPSEGFRDYYVAKGYPIPRHHVIHLRPFLSDLRFDPLPKLPGKTLVYAGGLVQWYERKGMVGYRAYNEILGQFIERGWEVHVYPSKLRPFSGYRAMGCIEHVPMPYTQLLREMSQYTAGFVGYNSTDVPKAAFAYTQACRPNKTWDYLAAGIPTIGFQCGSTGALFDGKWGVVLKSLDEEPELPEITRELRESQTMDQDLPKFQEVMAWMTS